MSLFQRSVSPKGCIVSLQSTYTGVYKKGGPTCVEPGKRLSDLVDRSQANGMASRRASLGVSPLQAAPNGNSATNGRKPAPIVTTLTPTYSGRWVSCSVQAS